MRAVYAGVGAHTRGEQQLHDFGIVLPHCIDEAPVILVRIAVLQWRPLNRRANSCRVAGVDGIGQRKSLQRKQQLDDLCVILLHRMGQRLAIIVGIAFRKARRLKVVMDCGKIAGDDRVEQAKSLNRLGQAVLQQQSCYLDLPVSEHSPAHRFFLAFGGA